ncbi:MAG: hypothetical protein WC464_06785 [Bdellovibrionales bacterium]
MTNKDKQTKPGTQESLQAILDKFLAAAEKVGIKFLDDGADELDAKTEELLMVAGYEKGTPKWLSIRERILNIGQGHNMRPCVPENGRFIAPTRTI